MKTHFVIKSSMISNYFLPYLAYSILIGLFVAQNVSGLDGPNICTKNETVPVEYEVQIPKPYEIRTLGWCLQFPPRCPKLKIVYRMEKVKKVRNETKVLKSCCKGYTEINDKCQPICSNECLHGKCIQPDVCECSPGWGGNSCNFTCQDHRYGPSCEHECICKNGAKCDPMTGSCTCPPGWIGRDCDQVCKKGNFGHDCKQICQCEHGDCNPVNGICKCFPGFTGPLCDRKCPEGRHGADCSNSCVCQNNGTCDHVTGKCVCTDGWFGEACTESCAMINKWGPNCTNVCDCFNGGVCHAATGECQCPPGFTGKNCENECPEGKYGPNCRLTCNCQNDATCDREDGTCICSKGYSGKTCEVRECPPGKYGFDKCDKQCNCHPNNTISCDPFDGSCKCKPGFKDLCYKQCPPPYFGQNCKRICDCTNGLCHHVTGDCICNAGWTGDKCDKPCFAGTYGIGCAQKCICFGNVKCNPENGQCDCPAGFSGLKCNRPCPTQKYGEKCSHDCRCKNGAACNPVTGSCTCLPGFTGSDCSQKCPKGTFGLNCKYECDCHEGNTADCDYKTGECVCKPGFEGSRCEQEKRCPTGKFGQDCERDCSCDGRLSCHENGQYCFCPLGATGNYCDKKCQTGSFGKKCVQDCPLCMHSNQTCNSVDGSCVCNPGYSGFFCEQTCPEGKFGHQCQNDCNCSPIGGQCDHENGKCICYPGWKGGKCSETCDEGTYGLECRQTCKCQNGATCRPTDGICFCPPGFMGAFCSETCPDGFYGENCLSACNCLRKNYVCDPVIGCTCKPGFTGPKCETMVTLASAQVDQIASNGDSNSWIVVSLLLIIICSILVAGIVYYRKKLTQIFDDKLYVHYSSSGTQDNDLQPRHFDNPVYSSSGPIAGNAKMMMNNLMNNHLNNHAMSPSGSGMSYGAKNTNLLKGKHLDDNFIDNCGKPGTGSLNNEYEVPNSNLYVEVEDDSTSKLTDKTTNFYHSIDEMDQCKTNAKLNVNNSLAKAIMNDYDIPRSSIATTFPSTSTATTSRQAMGSSPLSQPLPIPQQTLNPQPTKHQYQNIINNSVNLEQQPDQGDSNSSTYDPFATLEKR